MTEQGVLISIRPIWVRKILENVKGKELRTMMPRLQPPFTVYIYCTLNGPELWMERNGESEKFNGKVVAEFTCDRIDPITVESPLGIIAFDGFTYISHDSFNPMCLTKTEIYDYLKGKTGYAWNISELKAYQHFLELEDFNYAGSIDPVRKAPQGLIYVDNPHKRCINCKHRIDSECEKLKCFLHYETIFLNSCGEWELSDRGCYAINRDL